MCDCHDHLNDYGQLTCETYESISSIKIKQEAIQSRTYFNSYILTFGAYTLNISSQFIRELSYLFPPLINNNNNNLPQTTVKDVSFIKISLIFSQFQQLHFQDYVFYELFDETNQYQQQRQTTLNLEMSSNGQIILNPLTFLKLSVGQLIIHASSLGEYPFEYVFNNTNIGDLSIEGFTLKSNDTLRQSFQGNIKSAKFTKMAETLSDEEFPMVPVKSLIIEVHEPRRINSSSFLLYKNLNGLHIIQPRFNLDKNTFEGFQYLRNLETMVLDCEIVKEVELCIQLCFLADTFHHVPRLRFLTFGQNLKILYENSLNHLNSLERLDLDKILLDQLSTASRCVLAKFITNHLKLYPSFIVYPPKGEGCDCTYDYILAILNKHPSPYYSDNCKDSQQERCLLSECSVVQNFKPQPSASVSGKNRFNDSLTFDYLRIIDEQLSESTDIQQEQPIQHQPLPLFPVQPPQYQPLPSFPVQPPQYQPSPSFPVQPPQYQPSLSYPIQPPQYHYHNQNNPSVESRQSIYDNNNEAGTQVIILPLPRERIQNIEPATPVFLNNGSLSNLLPKSHRSSLLVTETTKPKPLIYTNNLERDNNKNNDGINNGKILDISSKHSKLETQKDDDDNQRIALKNETLKWIALSLLAVTVLCLLIVITIIWFFTCRPKKSPSGFKLVPHSSSV
ncbi:unnamed protein product [Didymodactylos carnosus]|uniref:Uncharacterized protein n=1 Tax=Didymodactylos carnosus TaxID=1234261 RepID=A0A8S2E6S6_9BILA|nr:unnamed protein product [Didymodactylos carnosus]CAF3866612.1 unnamed protein product [Didymodactylos carnosus]